ncbi:hypothetical protein Hanom_Chr15g01379461 [Helianthus anomalus]
MQNKNINTNTKTNTNMKHKRNIYHVTTKPQDSTDELPRTNENSSRTGEYSTNPISIA